MYLNTIAGVRSLESETAHGVTFIRVEFELAVDIEVAESVEISGIDSEQVLIDTTAFSSRSGDVHIDAGSVHVGAGRIANLAAFSGTAGDVSIEADRIEVDAGATIGRRPPESPLPVTVSVGDIDLTGDVVEIKGTIRSTAGDPARGGGLHFPPTLGTQEPIRCGEPTGLRRGGGALRDAPHPADGLWRTSAAPLSRTAPHPLSRC